MKKYYLEYNDHFDAAHFLRGYDGDCAKMHGHTWKIQMCVSGTELDPVGILIDFKVLKNIMKRCLPDHCCLNTHVPQFKSINPTAENLADYLFNQFEKQLPRNITLEFVKVWETEKACAIRAREVFIDGKCV